MIGEMMQKEKGFKGRKNKKIVRKSENPKLFNKGYYI